jgi:predicted nucleic acid-binding protein
MATLYLDTGALVKLYIVEDGSAFVQKRAAQARAILVNPLQETELRNAILAAGGRRTITPQAARDTLANFDEDLAAGYFTREQPDWPKLWGRADELARRHTPRLLCRTLDILHVAAAEQCGADQIITGDQRQQRLAKAINLPVIKIPQNAR